MKSCVIQEVIKNGKPKHRRTKTTESKNRKTNDRYRVNLGDLDGIGVEAITRAVTSSDAIIIDEIGPMELHSPKFREAIRKVAESPKLVVGIVHWKATDSLINEIKRRDDAEVHVVTLENRGNLHELVSGQALNFLQKMPENKEL